MTEPTGGGAGPERKKKGLWRGRSKWEKAAWIVLALIVIGVIGAALSPSDDEEASSPVPVVTQTEDSDEADESAAVTGKVRGRFNRDCLICDQRLKGFVKPSDVWCGWNDEKVVVHVTMRNDAVEHLTVNWHPSYVIAGGGEHGAGLTATQSDGFDAGERRDLLAEQDPEGVTPNSAIEECKPSFSVIESG